VVFDIVFRSTRDNTGDKTVFFCAMPDKGIGFL